MAATRHPALSSEDANSNSSAPISLCSSSSSCIPSPSLHSSRKIAQGPLIISNLSARLPTTTPLLLIVVLLLSLVLPHPLDAAPPSTTTVPRRGHTATLINDTIHFVGGQGSTSDVALSVKTISSFDMNELLFTETPTTLSVFGHAATSNRTIQSSNLTSAADNSIGISFGFSDNYTQAMALQWVNPATGEITQGSDLGNGMQLRRRNGHSLVQLGNRLWIHGGRSTGKSIPDTPTYDISGRVWSNRAKGLSRYGHASARVGQDKTVSCFGINLNEDPYLATDCVYFTIASATYSPARLRWTNPDDRITIYNGARMSHTLVTGVPNDHMLYMFGGSDDTERFFFQDVFQLDVSGLPDITITKIPITPAGAAFAPPARADHAAVTVGSRQGFMIIQGGYVTNNNNKTMVDPKPYFFDMKAGVWINSTAFQEAYQAQKPPPIKNINVWILITAIVAGTMVLGACTALYIRSGVKKDERKRLEKEAAERADSSSFSPMEENSPGRERNIGALPIYSLGNIEDHSLSMGPFKSTSSLIQSEDENAGGKSFKKKGEKMTSDVYQSIHSKSRTAVNSEPYSPGGTTLTENAHQSGYFSSSSNPSQLNKNNSNGSSQYSRQGTGSSGTAASSARGTPTSAVAGHEPYYNPRDLYIDEDDDSSITVSLASESTMSPWVGPARMSTDLAPPNPRFSRGAISQAHRQLVGSIITNNNNSTVRGGDSSGWDTSSPGGSLSSREDGEHQRRSVNSMQWVSFEPFDPSARPESGLFDPHAQRSNLTVRNASMYGNNRSSVQSNSNLNRMSTFDGSDSNTEDSGPYYSGPNGKRISTALAARQQRRSLRKSQDSQLSSSGEPFSTTVLPIVTSKVAKPTLAKVVTHQRGSRVVMPGQGALTGDRASDESELNGGLGIDFSGISGDGYLLSGTTNNSDKANRVSFTNSAAYQSRRGSSTLNPGHNRGAIGAGGGTITGSNNKRESKLGPSQPSVSNPVRQRQQKQRNSTNVVLQMPPPPKNHGLSPGKSGSSGDNNGGSNNNDPSGLRNSIMELGQDMPGFLNYGDDT
ncbi:hypothetical protein BGX28_002187 [Mortierella sp. GBA30]|nr:hypothetical protein BGX28_002187 [Mortierella sp. GBA30]